MKAHITMMAFLAGIIAFIPTPALSADSSIVAKGHMTSRHMAGVSRTFSIDQAGILHADIDDQGIKSELEIRPYNGTVEITRHQPWGTETSLIDVARANILNNTNSVVGKALQKIQAQSQAADSSFLTTYEYGPDGVSACNGELNALLKAADHAVSACSGGSGVLCVLASSDYYSARDRYNACLAREAAHINP